MLHNAHVVGSWLVAKREKVEYGYMGYTAEFWLFSFELRSLPDLKPIRLLKPCLDLKFTNSSPPLIEAHFLSITVHIRLFFS